MDIRLIGQKTVLSAYTARPAENAGKRVRLLRLLPPPRRW